MKRPCQCEYCGKHFASRQSKYNHKKKFHINGSLDVRMHELQHHLASVLAEIEHARKITPTCVVHNITNNNTSNITTNNITNNNTVTNNNVTININVFRRENTAYIQGELLKQLNTSDNLNESLIDLIKMIHFNKQHPENMNIMVSDGGQFALIYKTSGWERAPIRQVAECITFDAGSVMLDHIQDFEHQYQQPQISMFERWYDTIGKVPSLLDKAEKVAIDNSHIVAQTHNLTV